METLRPSNAAQRRQGYFYRPLRDDLKKVGIEPIRRGGWRGSHRSFETGFEDIGITYCCRAGNDTRLECWAGIRIIHDDYDRISNFLYAKLRPQIDHLQQCLEWPRNEDVVIAWIWVEGRGSIGQPGQPTSEWNVIRQWLFDNLIRLRDLAQPALNEYMVRRRT